MGVLVVVGVRLLVGVLLLVGVGVRVPKDVEAGVSAINCGVKKKFSLSGEADSVISGDFVIDGVGEFVAVVDGVLVFVRVCVLVGV